MRLKLIFNEQRKDCRELLLMVFDADNNVSILDLPAHELFPLAGLSAIVMLGMCAHERYGGNPLSHPQTADIRKIEKEKNMPPWVVIPPALSPYRLCKHKKPRNHAELLSKKDFFTKKDFRNACYFCFSRVFAAIKEFNSLHNETPIASLGISLEFLYIPLSDNPLKEITDLRKAYMETFGTENVTPLR